MMCEALVRSMAWPHLLRPFFAQHVGVPQRAKSSRK
jgi:hypothetical protein